MRRQAWPMALLALAGVCLAPPAYAADPAQTAYDHALKLLCGAGGQRNPRAAASLLDSAARQQHAGAQGLLGWMAMAGVGMPRDDTRAARWLRPAAEAGDTAAQNNLGVLYARGSGVPHDPVQAERWFRAAAARGAEDARANLDELLRPGPAAPAARDGSLRAPSAPRLHPALVAAGCRPYRARVPAVAAEIPVTPR